MRRWVKALLSFIVVSIVLIVVLCAAFGRPRGSVVSWMIWLLVCGSLYASLRCWIDSGGDR